jgi:hypothetical protein
MVFGFVAGGCTHGYLAVAVNGAGDHVWRGGTWGLTYFIEDPVNYLDGLVCIDDIPFKILLHLSFGQLVG